MISMRSKHRRTFKEQQERILELIRLYEEKLTEIIINQNILALRLGIDLEEEKNKQLMILFGSEDEEDKELAKELREKFTKTIGDSFNRMKKFGIIK